MSNLNNDRIRVSKIEAARHQLDTAIWLWFLDQDEISIHTLAAASHQVIHDLCKAKGLGELLYDSTTIFPNKREFWLKRLRRPQNFFKHADPKYDPANTDPNHSIEFSAADARVFFIFSHVGLERLGYPPSTALRVLASWLAFHEPEVMTPDYQRHFGQLVPVDLLNETLALSKKDFFEIAFKLLAGA